MSLGNASLGPTILPPRLLPSFTDDSAFSPGKRAPVHVATEFRRSSEDSGRVVGYSEVIRARVSVRPCLAIAPIRPKNPRPRLTRELYETYASKCYVEMVGDARVAARCRILRFTTRNFAVNPETTRRRI